MDVFTQTVLIIGRLEPQGVVMLGTGFLINKSGLIATTHHVAGSTGAGLVVLAPHIKNINEYQRLSDTSCQHIPCTIKEIDPFRDIAILESSITVHGELLPLVGFDRTVVGEEVAIFGFPHCVEGRRALTYQKAEIGAKIILETSGVQSKQAVINTQARPGQSGSVVVSKDMRAITGLLIGAWIPATNGISLGGINPRELHQTTHCISSEYITAMI